MSVNKKILGKILITFGYSVGLYGMFRLLTANNVSDTFPFISQQELSILIILVALANLLIYSGKWFGK